MQGGVEPQKKERGAGLVAFLEQAALVVVALASIAVGILHFTGILDHTRFADRLGSMTLVVLGLMAGYLVLERNGELRRHRSAIGEVSERVKVLQDAASQAASFFAGFTGDRFSELKLIYGMRSYSSRISNNEIRADREEVFSMWTDMLREASSFLAFNYVTSDEVWGTEGFAFNVAHALQIARIKLGCSIKRIFVIDTLDEYTKLRALMHAQSEAGIDVKWILKSELTNRPIVLEYLSDLGTWDFVSVDNEMLFCVDLDERRRMKGCWVSRSRERHRKAMHVFLEAHRSGHSKDDVPTQLTVAKHD